MGFFSRTKETLLASVYAAFVGAGRRHCFGACCETIVAATSIVMALGFGTANHAEAGTFVATGGMSTPRLGHTATLLSNGKVLIAGGDNSANTAPRLNTAELYDPVSGTFSPTGNLTTGRGGHTATKLADGRVLLVGGVDAWQTGHWLASAEIYDPATGTFTATGSMNVKRADHIAALLANGKVLIAGGYYSEVVGVSIYLNSAEVFDPVTGLFTPTGSMNSPRIWFSATTLNSGKVLVTGGCQQDGGTLASTELYDPATGLFTYSANLNAPRLTHFGSALLSDNKVLFAGGQSFVGTAFLMASDLYNPATGTVAATGNMSIAKTGATATLLLDGRVIVAGGYDGAAFLRSAEIFDPVTGTFSLTAGNMASVRYAHSATRLGNGDVLLVGGQIAQGTFGSITSSAELYVASAPAQTIFPLTVTAANGVITGASGAINCGATCSASVPAGTQVSLQTTANSGYTFSGWSGYSGCASTNPCIFNMPTSAVNITASFTATPPTIGSCANSPATPNLVFCDDFNGITLNTQIWNYFIDPVSVHDGIADIQQNVTDKATLLFTNFSPLKRIRLEVRHKLHAAGNFAGGIMFESIDPANGNFEVRWPNYDSLQPNAGACWNATTVVIRASSNSCFATSNLQSANYYDQWMVSIIEYDSETGVVKLDLGGDGSIDILGTLPPGNRFPINKIQFHSLGYFTGHSHQLDYVRVSGILADAQPPTVPTGFTASPFSANQVSLSWAASTDNVAVTSYKLYSDGILVATLGNLTSYGPLGVTPFGYTVAACDAAGNCSAQSQATTATPASNLVNVIPAAGTVAAGGSHALIIKPDGTLLAWGKNDSGQLGDGSTTLRTIPIIVGTGYSAVAGGGNHTAGIKTDGSLWTWGSNSNGQLGDGTTTSRSSPVMIGTGFKSVSAGAYHTVAIKADGTLWAWGGNGVGQLGDGTNIQRTSRVQIGTGFSAVAIGANAVHTLAIKNDASLWGWGLNNPFGSVGDFTSINRLSPVLVGTGYSSVALGGNYTMAVKNNGSLWGWGNNWFGNLGNGASRVEHNDPMQVGTGYISVSAGGTHTLGIRADGTLWAWGANFDGRLGNGSTNETNTPVQVIGGTGYASMAAGGAFSIAIRTDGTVQTWGENFSGQLGDGTLAHRNRPVFVRHENGTGTVAANDWYLDLKPAIAKVIPADKIPAFLAVATTTTANNVTANILYRAQDVGTTAKTYVFALAPANLVQSVSASSASSSSKGIRSAAIATATLASGSCVLAQLNSSGQLVATTADSLQAYLTGVLSAQGASVAVLNGVSTALLQGTTFFVGYGTSPSTMLSGGTNRSVLTIGELQACTTPSGFSFVPQTGVALNVPVTSSPLIISGANFVAAPISITNGNYRINNGPFVPSVGLILQGDSVAAQVVSSPAPNTQTCATVDISGVTSPFCVTTGQASVTNYTLTVSKDGMGTGIVNSNPTGIACGMDCSEDYASGTPVSLSAVPAMGSTFAGWSGECTGTTTCMVTMDGVKMVTATFAPAPVTTTPDPFTFNAQTGAGLNEARTSNTILLGGANFVSAPISITNGSYRINIGAYTANSGNVNSGDSVTLQLVSSPNYGTQRDATLNIGGVTGIFSVTTMQQPVTTAPLVTLSSTSLNFPAQYVGSVGASQMVNVTNSGNATLNFVGSSASGDFALINNCGSSLGSGNSCSLLVTFVPTVAGTRNGMIVISSDAAGSPHAIMLSGTGVLPSAPDAPIGINAIAGNGLASITFSPPANNGGAVVTSYVATCVPGPVTVSGYYPPIIVTGLTNGATYTCSVTAANAAGTSVASTGVNVSPAASIPFALIGARSRKIHGATGAFELPIDLMQSITDMVTVEPRFLGGGHKIVFQFNGPVSSVGGVGVTPLGSAAANYSGNEVVVTVWNIPDNRRATVTLTNVNGSTPAQASLGFLVGDVNSSGSINSGDISAVKARVGQATHGANFKFDLNASGSINTGDTSIVKARAGLVLP